MGIILASASPRRRELLSLITKDFKVVTADVEEHTACTLPADIVKDLARQKGEAVKAAMGDDELIISADTLVFHKGARLGKPRDNDEAFKMIAELQGDTHEVHTGFCLLYKGKMLTASECSRVTFVPMNAEEIAKYVAKNECLDKAGAYGIQASAAVYVERIEGCYSNVVGLPLALLYKKIQEFCPQALN